MVDTSEEHGGRRRGMGMRARRARFAPLLAGMVILATWTVAWSSWACPGCPVGRAARQQVCDDGFATNLMVALVPFLAVGLVSLWAERIGKAR